MRQDISNILLVSAALQLFVIYNVQMGSMLHCRAVAFDKKPFLRFLICKHSPLLEQDLHSIVDAYLGGRDFYVPSPLLPQSVFEATRVACRFPVSPLNLSTDQKPLLLSMVNARAVKSHLANADAICGSDQVSDFQTCPSFGL